MHQTSSKEHVIPGLYSREWESRCSVGAQWTGGGGGGWMDAVGVNCLLDFGVLLF